MLPSFCRDEIMGVRAGTKTVRGATVQDWDHASRHPVGGVSVQPAATSTGDDGARVNAVVDSATVYAPPGADIKAGDRIEHDAATWRVVGAPHEVRSPTGRVSHKVLTIQAFEG